MGFSEKIKAKIRKLSHMQCCVCKAIGVEIHHIIPKEEGGNDAEENAAPLCPSCHETYGSNPSKRKFIREARDNWFEICERRYRLDERTLSDIKRIMETIALKGDIESLKSDLLSILIPEMQKLGQLLDKNETTSAEKSTEYAHLDNIIALLYRINYEQSGVEKKHVDFFFEFMFGDDLGDEGIEEIKQKFIFRFGIEGAKKLCAYSLLESGLNLDEGFTEPEIHRVVQASIIQMVAMLNHEDLIEGGQCFRSRICEDNCIRWQVVSDKENSDLSTHG